MTNNKFIQFLLLPFTLLFAIGVSIRNFAYLSGFYKSSKFNLPIISVGNVSVGGTGKTPHILYIANYLKEYINVGVLSRGYGRKTKGYIKLDVNDSAKKVGDEPLLFKHFLPENDIAVCERRAIGIPNMVQENPELETILLDDAFQHRAVQPSYNILLTEYKKPFYDDYLMPAGRLREFRSAYKRADTIIFSKCPNNITEADKAEKIKALTPYPHQNVFFTTIKYGLPYHYINPDLKLTLDKSIDVLVFCGIARPEYLINYVSEQCNSVAKLILPDHHDFTNSDIRRLASIYNQFDGDNKVVITTEKDLMRLKPFEAFIEKENIIVYVLPLEIEFLFGEGDKFKASLQQSLLEFRS